jgi:hypothetical protein
MKTVRGECGLCGNVGDLRESHLMPAAVYKLIRDPIYPNPVIVSQKSSFSGAHQVAAHFLDEDCEQRFARHEGYVVPQCVQVDGGFKLRELLQTASPSYVYSDSKAYDVQSLLGEKIEHYLYFAASIIWRASARQWKNKNEEIVKISLGSMYDQQFRLYLLDRGTFPKNSRLLISVSEDSSLHRQIIFPYTNKIDGVFRHDFYIPGIRFTLLLGNHAPIKFDAVSLNGNKRQLMWLSPWENDGVFHGSKRLIDVSIPRGKLKNAGR